MFLSIDPKIHDHICQFNYMVFLPARTVSVLQELHIAVYALSVAFRSNRLLRILSSTIPILWCVGVTFGLGAVFTNPWNFSKTRGICLPTYNESPLAHLDLFCGALAFLIYLTVVLKSILNGDPSRVEQRRARQLAVYPLNFVLTYGFITICYLTGFITVSPVGWAIASVLESFNGLLNVGTYACQSRYAPSIQELLIPDCDVEDAMCNSCKRTSSVTPLAEQRLASWTVGFDDRAEIYHVSADQVQALEHAECQIQDFSLRKPLECPNVRPKRVVEGGAMECP